MRINQPTCKGTPQFLHQRLLKGENAPYVISPLLKINLPEVLDSIFTRDSSVHTLTMNLNNATFELLDSGTPVKNLKAPPQKNLIHWLNEEINNLRRNCRKSKRSWRWSRLVLVLRACWQLISEISLCVIKLLFFKKKTVPTYWEKTNQW